MKKVYVNEDACVSCGACVAMAGEYFQFNEKGISCAVKEEIEDTDLNLIESVADSCPVDAIEITEASEEQLAA